MDVHFDPAYSMAGSLMLKTLLRYFPPSSGSVLSSRTQRRALPRQHSEENGKINLSKYLPPRAGIEPTTSRFYSHTLCHATTGLNKNTWKYFFIYFITHLHEGSLIKTKRYLYELSKYSFVEKCNVLYTYLILWMYFLVRLFIFTYIYIYNKFMLYWDRYVVTMQLFVGLILTYLNKLFSFPRFGNKRKRGVKFHHITHNVSKSGKQGMS